MQRLLSTVLVCGLALSGAAATAGDMEPAFPVQPMYDLVTAGDIDGAVEYLTDDAVYVIVTAPRPWEAPAIAGRVAISAWWAGMHKDNGRFEVGEVMMDGDRASFDGRYYGDRLDKIGMSPAEFDGVVMLRDGKVRLLALSYSAEYEPKLRAAMAKISN